MEAAICTVAYPGAGNDVAARAAKARDIPVVSMGRRVRERAKAELGEDLTSDDTASSEIVGEWVAEQREKQGQGIVGVWTLGHVAAELNNQIVLINGLRSPEAYERFQEAFNRVLLIHIDADKEARLHRLQEEATQDEQPFTETDLERRDQREQAWGIDTLTKQADATVAHELGESDACVDELTNHVNDFLADTQ